MKRLLTSLTFLILATGCGQFSSYTEPSGGYATGSATLTGTVAQSTADGFAAVDGAVVELLLDDGQNVARSHKNARPSDAIFVTSTTTGADGRFEFSNVTFGTYVLRVTKAGYLDYYSGSFQFSSDLAMSAELRADPNAPPTDPTAPQKIRR